VPINGWIPLSVKWSHRWWAGINGRRRGRRCGWRLQIGDIDEGAAADDWAGDDAEENPSIMFNHEQVDGVTCSVILGFSSSQT
jgi:hypothetical protein